MSNFLLTAKVRNCRTCGGQHFNDNGRFCWIHNAPSRPIKLTRKERADLAARGLLRIDHA